MTEETARLTKELIDNGLLIEAGFIELRRVALDPNASDGLVMDMRTAFFAGAQHVFASIAMVLDPGDEPTEDDLKRMDAIQAELDRFIKEFEARHMPPKGTA